MSDLIERQKAIDATWFEPYYTDPLNVLTEVRDRLEALPSAQRTGRWIYNDYGNGCGNWHCSACNNISIVYDKNAKYCPNCGAEMTKGEEDE